MKFSFGLLLGGFGGAYCTALADAISNVFTSFAALLTH